MTVSLTSCPAVRRRGPPPTSTHRPYGEGHHRTRELGHLWREGAPGAARPQDRHHLQRPTPWPSRRWPPGSPEASGDEWLHRASNRWPRFVVVYGRWPGPTLPRLSATARSAGMRLRSTLVIRRTCRAPRCELLAPRSFVVAGAGQWSAAVEWSRSLPVALLYLRAVRLPARLVRPWVLSFRFSGGFAGPGESITGWLTRPYDALALLGVQGLPQASTAVVSRALARSAGIKRCVR
jgi:hypothetical protein